ncbi:MAG: type II secretion system F family protein [Planctomycetales bacterium]|nr:type II secretion system F family protein [Planctomycetales bacterium]
MKLRAVAAFCRRMGTGLRAGVDILKLLELEQKSGDARHRAAMQQLTQSIRSGNSLAKGMLEQKSYFPPLLVQMVHASELGGRMDGMFTYMADYYQQLKQTRTLFIGRITWPLVQLLMAVGVIGLVILIQGMLSPNSTYDASGVGLRGLDGFFLYCLVVGLLFGMIGVLIYGLWKNWFHCHRVLMPIVQRIPTVGSALVNLGLSRLSMTLSMLLNAGVEAKRSTRQAFLATGNYYFIGGAERAVAEVAKGASFGDAFAASRVLPQEFIESVRIGELSGTETESLDHLALQYQERAQAALQTLAMLASFAIWLSIMFLLAFMIIRLALQYISMLNSFLP